MIYNGTETDITTVAKDLFQQLNTPNLLGDTKIIVSTDLKSLWVMINGRYKYTTDDFCPYCRIKKCQIEDKLRCKGPQNG